MKSTTARRISVGPRRKRRSERNDFPIAKRMHHLPDSWHEFLAFDGDRVIGRIACFVPQGSKDCWINALWVERERRGKGIGTELIMMITDDANRYTPFLG